MNKIAWIPRAFEDQNLPGGQDDFAFRVNDMYNPSMFELDAVSFHQFVAAPGTIALLEDNPSRRSFSKHMEI